MILEHKVYDLISGIPIHVRYYDDHVLHEIPQVMILCIVVVLCNDHDIESYASIYMLYEFLFHV